MMKVCFLSFFLFLLGCSIAHRIVYFCSASLRFASLRSAPLRSASLRSASLRSCSFSIHVQRYKVARKAPHPQLIALFQSLVPRSVLVRSSRGSSVARFALPPHFLTKMVLRAPCLGGAFCLISTLLSATLASSLPAS